MSEAHRPVCTIVGAGPGVSMAVARAFAKQGFRLGLIARNTEKLGPPGRDLASQGADVTLAAGDAGIGTLPFIRRRALRTFWCTTPPYFAPGALRRCRRSS
jgi:NAD(P)-dependent dehydrogenase (short-subunit alcohol dehydrogenase family)